MQCKYPKTMHLPFSKGLQNDDRRLEDDSCFDNKVVAVTVKMDGENTSMYRGVGNIHARSLSSAHHPSRSYVKAIHSSIQHRIPKTWRICGENIFAKHSIYYIDLESYFQVFNIWNEKNYALSLDHTLEFCTNMGLNHVKIVDILIVKDRDFSKIEEIYTQLVADGHEGIVIRNIESFHFADFKSNVAKAVRANHIQTDKHWMQQQVIPNLLDGKLHKENI